MEKSVQVAGMAEKAAATGTAAGKRVRFRLAGYLFTYKRACAEARVKIEMWREDPESGERHWVTVAACAPTRESARSVALALVAWVRACDVGPKRTVQAQAVAESFALLGARLAEVIPGARGAVHARPAPRELTRPGAFGGTRDAAA